MRSLKTDILLIDTLREGTEVHCLPIYKELAHLAPHINMKTFHRESLYSRGASVPKVDCIEGIERYDISYFPWRRNLERIIRQFNPRVVLLLTHSFLFDRAVISLCRRIGIQTIFLQHGAVNFSAYKPQPTLYMWPAIYVNKFRLYLFYYLPMYFKAVAPADPLCMLRLSFVKFLVGSFFVNYAFVPPRPTPEVRADQALAYGEFYAEKFKRLHGYQDNQVHIVGNPTFDPVIDVAKSGAMERKRWLRARNLDPSKKSITYLAQPLVEEGYVSKHEFQKYLATLVRQAKIKGLNLIIKLHPRNNVGLFPPFTNKECIAIEENNLAESVYFSDVVIGHYSTALGLAVAACRPVIIWNAFKSMSGPLLDPENLESIARVATSQDELESILEDLSNNEWEYDRRLYNEWMQQYSYFDPKEKAIQRIAKWLIAEYKAPTENLGEE